MQNRQLVHPGMTLVELLVVVAIMVLLLAVSVPIFKPMLESQKTSNAARVLEGAFQQARAKAMYEQRSYGVRLLPFDNAPAASIELRIQKTNFVSYVNPPHIRVQVEKGIILPYYFDDGDGEWKSPPGGWDATLPPDLQNELEQARGHFEQSANIRFNRIGRSFKFLASGNAPRLLPPYHHLELPEDLAPHDALEYHVFGPSDITMDWIPPMVMPRGTIVDLAFSGGEAIYFDGERKEAGDIPFAFPAVDELIIEFSPAGHVDWIYADGNQWKVNEMLYFCVGDWDRQVSMDASGNLRSLAEDGGTNLEAPATYWVTLHPKTGVTRVTQNAPILPTSSLPETRLRDARKFASEHFFNVGGN